MRRIYLKGEWALQHQQELNYLELVQQTPTINVSHSKIQENISDPHTDPDTEETQSMKDIEQGDCGHLATNTTTATTVHLPNNNCPNCGSGNTIGNGRYRDKLRRVCKDCRKSFIV